MILPTMKVERQGGKGFKIINKSDFNPKIHKLWESPEAKAATKKLADDAAKQLADAGKK